MALRALYRTNYVYLKALRIALILVCFSRLAAAMEPEPPFERGLELIRNELQLAHSGFRALSVAAHPDDEDGGTLSYLRRTLGVETHLCLFTRGEGGQNESGPELGAKLAVLRTRETEAACAILGAKAWYLNLPDFGYSKSPDEAMRVWRHDEALAQMVRVIRIVRPHVIFTNHDPDGTDHGHHRAAARILVEAFDAAADAAKFPEQMKDDGTQPWQAAKLYIRHFAPLGATLNFDVSVRDMASGLSASEIAAYALSKHISQGMQRDQKIGEKDMRHFTLAKIRPGQAGQIGNETTMLDGLAGSVNKALADEIDATLKKADPASLNNGSLAGSLIALCSKAAKAEADGEAILPHLHNALTEVLGLKLEVNVSAAVTTAEEPVSVGTRIANTGNLPVEVRHWKLVPESAQWTTTNAVAAGAKPDAQGKPLAPGENAEFKGEVTAHPDAFPTWPLDEFLFKRMESRKPIRVAVTLAVTDPNTKTEAELLVVRPVPLDLATPFSTTILPDPVLVFDDPDHGDTFLVLAKFRLALTNHHRVREPFNLFAGIQLPDNATVDKTATFQFHCEDETVANDFRFMAPVEKLNQGDIEVPLTIWSAATNYGGPLAHVRRVPLTLPSTLNVGLVKTYDDSTWQALKLLESSEPGLTVTLLSPEDVRASDLNRFHTIILDIRATQFRPEVRKEKERLMQFMRDGGNVVCMYHKDLDWNNEAGGEAVRGRGFLKGQSGGGEIAPYPIELSFERVTDEDAPVRILDPSHTLLCEPCKIWERDFKGWVQERAVYFPKKWAPEYTPLLSCNDPGDAAHDGGLLFANVGDGSFIYTSFVWYRQLRAGNPGAYRILANLISYPRVKHKKQ